MRYQFIILSLLGLFGMSCGKSKPSSREAPRKTNSEEGRGKTGYSDKGSPIKKLILRADIETITCLKSQRIWILPIVRQSEVEDGFFLKFSLQNRNSLEKIDPSDLARDYDNCLGNKIFMGGE